ncbi:MAG: hypothetical protein WKF87_22575 [Chryseolinea sp.]
MKNTYPIPRILKERPLDSRGYVIPYFAPIIDGVPDFRFQSELKRKVCLERLWCSICGKELYMKSFWFISGPKGLANQTASDAPMHEDCARYSLNVCPHMQFEKAERKSEDGTYLPDPFFVSEKPQELYLIKADKYQEVKYGQHSYLKFRPVYTEKYVYADNKLVKA